MKSALLSTANKPFHDVIPSKTHFTPCGVHSPPEHHLQKNPLTPPQGQSFLSTPNTLQLLHVLKLLFFIWALQERTSCLPLFSTKQILKKKYCWINLLNSWPNQWEGGEEIEKTNENWEKQQRNPTRYFGNTWFWITHLAFKRMEIASITVMTKSGGLVKTLISEISALSKESSALLAASSAGRASSRSLWASSAIAWVSSAFTFAIASSSCTMLRT